MHITPEHVHNFSKNKVLFPWYMHKLQSLCSFLIRFVQAGDIVPGDWSLIFFNK